MKRRAAKHAPAAAPAKRTANVRPVAAISIRSDVTLPARVLPWERVLLLPHVRELIDAVLQEGTADADNEG